MVNDMAECFVIFFLMVNKTETKLEHDPNVFVRIKPSFKSPHHSVSLPLIVWLFRYFCCQTNHRSAKWENHKTSVKETNVFLLLPSISLCKKYHFCVIYQKKYRERSFHPANCSIRQQRKTKAERKKFSSFKLARNFIRTQNNVQVKRKKVWGLFWVSLSQNCKRFSLSQNCSSSPISKCKTKVFSGLTKLFADSVGLLYFILNQRSI